MLSRHNGTVVKCTGTGEQERKRRDSVQSGIKKSACGAIENKVVMQGRSCSTTPLPGIVRDLSFRGFGKPNPNLKEK